MALWTPPPDIWVPPKPAIIIPAPKVRKPVSFAPAWLPGIAMPFAPVTTATTPISSSFTAVANDTVNRTIYTFTAQAIGAADATRRVLVGITTTSVSAVYSSATIGGVTATTHINVKDGVTGRQVVMVSALVPTGTTADIVVTWGSGVGNCGVGVWRIINETVASPNATASSTTTTSGVISTTINIPSIANCLFAFTVCGATGGPPTTVWSGVTEDYDAVQEGIAAHSGGHIDGLAAETGRTVSATMTTGSPIDSALGVLVWA